MLPFARIADTDASIQAFLTLNEEGAREAAAELDRAIAAGGERGLLFGLPAGIKDNIVTEGLAHDLRAANFCDNYDPIYDATVMKKLKRRAIRYDRQAEHGRVRDGRLQRKLQLPSDAQPVEPDYVPGGSSGGSAAAGRGGTSLFRAWLRYRRLHPPTGGLLRRRRPEADLRPRIPLRPRRFCFFARPDRSDDEERRRFRLRASGDRRL